MKEILRKVLKRIPAGILCASLVLGTAQPLHSFAETNLKGDFNHDGVIDVSDAVEILTYYAKKCANWDVSLSEEQLQCADINGDGMLSVEDAVGVLTYYAKSAAGLEPTWDTETTTTETTTIETTTETTTETEVIPIVTTLQTHANGAVIPPNTGNQFVILNTSTMCYHLSSTCRAAKRINAENYAEVWVAGVGDVEQYGYTACGICAK